MILNRLISPFRGKYSPMQNRAIFRLGEKWGFWGEIKFPLSSNLILYHAYSLYLKAKILATQL
jgi:hypothetical protein